MAKVNIKVTGFAKLKTAMKRVEVTMPEIRKQTLNQMAFRCFTLIRMDGGTLDRAFDLRNKFTQRSVIFTKASTRPGSVSMVGSVQEYLAVQEEGEARPGADSTPR